MVDEMMSSLFQHLRYFLTCLLRFFVNVSFQTLAMMGQAILKSMAFTTNAMVYQFLMHQSSSTLQAFGESSDAATMSSMSSTDLLTNFMMTMKGTTMMGISNIHLSDTECLLLAACFSGLTTSFFVVPIERIKIMMQSQPNRKRTSLSRSIALPLMDDDTRASFRTSLGGSSSGMSAVTSSSSALAGTAAMVIRPATTSSRSNRGGGSVSSLTPPSEISGTSHAMTYAATMISTSSSSKSSSSYTTEDNRRIFYVNELHCAKKIIEKDGWYGFFFRGLTPTIWREVPRYGLYFVVYDLLMQWEVLKGIDAFYLPLIGGAVAGCISWLPVYPADVIKTSMQNTEGGQQAISHHHTNPVELGKHMYEKGGGIGTFYGGLTPKLLRAAMINAVTFFMYDTVVDILST
jgi:Mitochondrial carrier protein